jgi:hypothetical protein
MARSSSKPRYKMQAAAGTGGSSPSPSRTLDLGFSYSSSSLSTASTSIFPGIPKTPEREKVHWVGQPLIPRRITAKKKKKKIPRALNSGYISSDTSRDASVEQLNVCIFVLFLAFFFWFSGHHSDRIASLLLVTINLFARDSA